MVPISSSPALTTRRISWLSKLADGLVASYLVIATLAFAITPFLVATWNLVSLFSYLAGIIYLGSGWWIFISRREIEGSSIPVQLFASIALAVGLLFELRSNPLLTVLWTFGLCLTSASLLTLAFCFPKYEPILEKFPQLLWLFYAISATLFLAWLASPLVWRELIWQLSGLAAGCSLLFAMLWLGLRRLKSALPVENEQIRFLLVGALIAFLPAALGWVVLPFFGGPTALSPYLLLPLAAFPIIYAYAIQRNRLVHIDLLLSQASLYALMAVLVVIGYALLVGGLSLAFSGALKITDQPAITGLIFFVLAVGMLPLREYMQNVINSAFFRGQKPYQDRLQIFSRDLNNLVDLPSILHALRNSIDNSLIPAIFHIFIFDPLSEQYVATLDSSDHASSDLRFSADSPLVIFLSQQHSPIFLGDAVHLSGVTPADQHRIDLLGAKLFAPLSGRERLAGWLALGPRRSGEPYTHRELDFLNALCSQATLAIERAQVVVNMENRVRETNVLARIAQGVNITLTMDDTLELVYAQTTQVIPANDFHVILVDRQTQKLVEVFCVSEDERYPQLENIPLSGRLVEEEVVRLRRPILSSDYSQECQRLGAVPNHTGIISWMAVPLNAGAETIGLISLGRYDTTIYSTEQFQLLQAIADQVAGAIEKMRLLQETEKRAHQLASLNEVTRQLTSTLELEPLLANILNSAVDILNCEAGSLLLSDSSTGELVFRATVGPVAENLLNKRLPAGTGLVGKAYDSRAALIVNDVQSSSLWFQKTDQQTGFISRAILVVPLISKGQSIGVIEVINKKDGAPFIQDDQDLLSTFAAQASVAVENATLFTQTDQALAARVEELSVMQRIDRELNTSLDVTTTMKIALEWAMSQSDASAGMIGVVQDEGLKVMASQGYSTELASYPSNLIPFAKFSLQQVVESGTIVQRSLSRDESGNKGFLAQAVHQIILPIRREANTIGLILLESVSPNPLSEENVDFLQRLGDHASIAISNAQLVAAIQSANVAKSEFVSFVAHELKNPMTSIKGYTELLAAGAVGSVNEAQSNFLATIRSNIERMNTLVSDLNDLSKIEAGRLRLEFKPHKLAAVVEDTVRSTRKQIEEKGQQLTIQIPSDLPDAWADRTRLAQILINLVSNAHKYTPQGGQIQIGAQVCENRWDISGAPKVIHIWVADNGIGISPEDQKKIFQKFFRSEDPKTREVPGTGLGLNITRSLVEMQGGRIWFESELRHGTTFHFTVPISE